MVAYLLYPENTISVTANLSTHRLKLTNDEIMYKLTFLLMNELQKWSMWQQDFYPS